MTHTMKTNNAALDAITKKLLKAKLDIKNSNHDRLYVGDCDYEPEDECLVEWTKSLGIPMPMEFKYSSVKELPEEYWSEIFGDPETNEELDAIKSSEEYKSLFELYDEVFSDMYEAATEESAYYENEYQEEQKYYDSMRGPL